MRKRWLSVVIAVGWILVVAVMLRAFLPRAPEVEGARVSPGPLRSILEYTGKTRVHDRYTVLAPISGHLSRITLHPGDAVSPRLELARLRPLETGLLDARSQREARAALAAAQDASLQARARLEATKKAYEESRAEASRKRSLREKGAASVEESERASFEAQRLGKEVASAAFAEKVAAHEVERARAVLSPGKVDDETRSLAVFSPVDGVVLRVPAPSEGPVTAGAPLLEVGSLSLMEVLVEAQTPDAVLLRPGMKVEMADWGGGKTLHGRVQRIEPSAFKAVSPLGVEEQRVNVVIDFSSNPETRPGLGDGYELTVRFILWESDRVLKVPSAAVFRENRDWAVWRVEGKRARLRKVVLGRRGVDEVEVESGLEEGDVVILHPPGTVEEGAAVTLR